MKNCTGCGRTLADNVIECAACGQTFEVPIGQVKAWKLIENEANWTQGCAARDADGRAVFSQSKSATCWCALGAIGKCYPSPTDQEAALNLLIGYVRRNFNVPERGYDLPHDLIGRWNDAPGVWKHAEVVRALQELNI